MGVRVRPKAGSPRSWRTGTAVLGVALGLLAFRMGPAAQPNGAAPKRQADADQRITFEVALLPADPFSDLNQFVPPPSILGPATWAGLVATLANPEVGPYPALAMGTAHLTPRPPPSFQRGEVITLAI